MGRKRDALAGLQRTCEHKLANPAGSLVIVKAHSQASIRSGSGERRITHFPLTVADFDTLVNWGFLKPDPHALRGAKNPIAFHITDAGWARYRKLAAGRGPGNDTDRR